jgi:hypothetical protein
MGCGASKDAALLAAARDGDIESARAALAAGANPNGTRQVRATRHAPNAAAHAAGLAGARICPIAPRCLARAACSFARVFVGVLCVL